MKKTLLPIIIILFTLIIPAKGQWHWESIVLESDVFSYIVPAIEPTSDWMQVAYNDGTWDTGNGGFGYGDDDDVTIVPDNTPSVYLRKIINLPSSLEISQLLLDIDYDDAFVAYINGVEVARSNNLVAGTPALSGSVTTDHEAHMWSGGLPERFILEPGVLLDGDNLLAVHILNMAPSSSDFSSRIFLNAELDSDQQVFSTIPSWFIKPVSYTSSNLPIVIINTEGQNIPDEPKITSMMKVIDNIDGHNDFSDTSYTYNGYIGIEIRGNTAQMFEKKSYSIETRLPNGDNNNVPLLGLPVENDWVFHGPYSDKSLMRNVLAYNIGNEMGRGWHPRNRYVELIINDEYRGVYLVVEKIKIDNDRVDIANLLPTDIEGDELTGGYIMSIDRDQEGSWNSPFMGRTGSVDVPFSYVDPKYNELTPEQQNYIKDYVTDFEYALHGDDYRDPDLGYRAYIDVISFIDYFIITELSKDLDGYRVSVYFHKDKDSNGGKLTMTPFWDYNICFGNANFFAAGDPIGYASDGIGAGDWYEIPFWWDKFRTDPYFETLLKYRWEELREDAISSRRIDQVIDSIALLLSDAQVRNFEKYNILGSSVWPNNYVGGSYVNEVNYLKNWFYERLDWLDSQIDLIIPVNITIPTVLTSAATNVTSVSAIVGVNISDIGGSPVNEKGIYWDTLPDPSLQGTKISNATGGDTFFFQISDLIPQKQYYIQAYANNAKGTGYGDILSFTTGTGYTKAAVATIGAIAITDSSATVGGSILSDGGTMVTETGVFLSEQINPELGGTKIQIESKNNIFLTELSGLEAARTYYVKAYAINEVGINYGVESSFVTKDKNVGIKDQEERIKAVRAYPNPFTESFTIDMELNVASNVRMVITNILGEHIYDQSRDFTAGSNQFVILEDDMGSSSNIYMYKVIVNGLPVYNGKIIKR